MLTINKPFEDGAIRLVRVHISGQSALVTGRVIMSQKVVVTSGATYDRLGRKFGRGEIIPLDARCDADWRVLICME